MFCNVMMNEARISISQVIDVELISFKLSKFNFVLD